MASHQWHKVNMVRERTMDVNTYFLLPEGVTPPDAICNNEQIDALYPDGWIIKGCIIAEIDPDFYVLPTVLPEKHTEYIRQLHEAEGR